MNDSHWQLEKRPTGIPGLDRLTHGGLPYGQATLIVGQPGAGKTVLALQVLAHAVAEGDGGVFVTFEESPAQVRRNADSFCWGENLNQSEGWTVIDARLPIGAESSGAFDIDGLLAAIGAPAEGLAHPWIVIDGIDQLLKHQPDPLLAVDQIRQVNEHCERHGWTLLLSGKVEGDRAAPRYLEGVEFMLPTTLVLTATMIERRLHRYIRIAKYRGSSHNPDQVPVIINDDGIQLPYQAIPDSDSASASTERISTGIERLDQLLGGGPYRGSSTLISGRPGTAKSTLAAGFAEAAARRHERTLYVSFDEMQAPYVRNLASVGLDLQPHIDAGRIRFCALSAWSALISEHVLMLRRLIEEFNPHCLVIDPISALLKAAGSEGPRTATERILGFARSRGITTVLTSLSGEGDPEGEATAVHVSTVADTWIVLDYNVRAGERNRSLSIVKSRGSAHSNQQRELILSEEGITLADVYEYGTEVLMGTARLQKESEEKAAARRRELKRAQHREDLKRRLQQARSEAERLSTELELEEQGFEEADRMNRNYTDRMKAQRDPARSTKDGGDDT
ncbi:ATPase domain-containing protein [Wenzhouxiangella limi]|uniref:non-specific serine/threonine protein kinase n=1 Tax=Wenzhouxiangella limi TaxID=2707351 RepID=A0A845V922_9GAMM|nr:ATPase domain-containing protein [Wenzhouxiangella limi]NDY96651.1 AAA family ATPase [Wenzhouxiangella limi]